MSISNLEKGYGAIASGTEPKPTKSSWRRTLVALAAASVVVVGGTAAYSAHTAKTHKVTSLVSDEECKTIREECCLSMSTKRGAGYNACMNGSAGDWDFA